MNSEKQRTNQGKGTQKFMAHEFLNEQDYNEKVDIYSFGVIMYFILSGGNMQKITIIQIPPSFTQFAKTIINDSFII